MNRFCLPASAAAIAAGAAMLAACAESTITPTIAPLASTAPSSPPSIRPEQIAGRWSYGAYYDEKDRARTQAAAKAMCSRPITISRGPNGGLIMPMVNPSLTELSIKGGPGGKNFIGPPGEAGGEKDSEIVSFDGNVLITRTVASDGTGHATSVYVRCGPKA
jgi:hypothetical protein